MNLSSFWFYLRLAQVNKQKLGFNQQNLIQRRFRNLTPVSRNCVRFP